MDLSKSFTHQVVNRIRLKRIELGLTQAQLADKVNMSPIIYGHVESGRRDLRLYELVLLCNALHIDIKQINSDAFGDISAANGKKKLKPLKNKIISFTSFKGGVGVSTLAVLFSNEIAQSYRVLLIDAHYQASCFSLRESDLQIYSDSQPLYEVKKIPLENLHNYVTAVKSSYDFIVIDLPRIFYITHEAEKIFEESDYILAPFHLSHYRRSSFKKYTNPFDYVDGRLDLFIQLVKKLGKLKRSPEISLIPFRDTIDKDFVEWIQTFNIHVIPRTFKAHSEIGLTLDTFNALSSNETASYAPYIKNTMSVLYYIMEFTESNLIIEDRNRIKVLRWNNLMKKA